MKNNLFVRKSLAMGVHLFTATGAIWGLLALIAVFHHEWRQAILWMILAMLVDGFDGMLARWAKVKTYAAHIDGELLDNILDYLNYVVVPALFLLEADFLPAGWRWIGAFAILLTSAYQFTQVDAKTDESNDYFFKGFPSYWNVNGALYARHAAQPLAESGLSVDFQSACLHTDQVDLPHPNSTLATSDPDIFLHLWVCRHLGRAPVPERALLGGLVFLPIRWLLCHPEPVAAQAG